MAMHVATRGLQARSSARCSRVALAVTCSSVRPVLRPFSGSSSSAAAARRGPQQQSLWVLRAAEEPAATDALALLPDPDTAKEAIELGNKYAAAKRWTEALAVFEKALSLPGTGLKRYRDKPRLASDGEKQAALYNCACCHSQLGDIRSGLVALAGALELGYDDYAQLRRDPDLEALRQDARFEGLVARFEPKAGAGLLGFNLNNLFGGR